MEIVDNDNGQAVTFQDDIFRRHVSNNVNVESQESGYASPGARPYRTSSGINGGPTQRIRESGYASPRTRPYRPSSEINGTSTQRARKRLKEWRRKRNMCSMKLQRAIRASIVRAAFLFHGVAAIFCVVYTSQNSHYWFLGVGFIFLAMEMVLTYSFNEDGEWKWFVPSSFIYMAVVVPVVWFMELESLDLRLDVQARVGLDNDCPTDISSTQIKALLCLTNNSSPYDEVVKPLDEQIYDMQQLFSTTLQQTLMLILIVGRWMMPRGQLTRDQLSQLLLVYIGMAADMLEFSLETLKLDAIACRKDMFYVILGIWSWSLLQFTLGLTATKARKRRVFGKVAKPADDENSPTRVRNKMNQMLQQTAVTIFCCGTETWALMTSVILQDGPYLFIRLYLIIKFRIFDQSMIFFTCKNALLLLLQFYRLFVIITETKKAHALSMRRRQSMAMEAHASDLYGHRNRNGSVYAIHPIPAANGNFEVGIR